MSEQRFQPADVVIHPRRPEWGTGVVKRVRQIQHQGRPAQRVAVDFANKGRAVINTAIAPLAHKPGDKEGEQGQMSRTTSNPRGSTAFGRPHSGASDGGWLAELERASGNASHELWELPEAMTDPFTSPRRRLEATLDSYRFSTQPRELIEWAVIQTGLDDPLSRYTRPELEQAFPRFARDRDEHLRDLVRRIERQQEDADVLHNVLSRQRHPAARRALEKAMRR